MPYVIKNPAGQWLRKYPHRSTRFGAKNREWVDELDRASVWEKIGHAKAASSQAKVANTEIQEVRLMLWGLPIPHKPKRLR